MQMELAPPSLELPALDDLETLSLLNIMRSPETCWPRELLEQGHVHVRAGHKDVVFLSDPEVIREVLMAPRSRFMLTKYYRATMAPAAGKRNFIISPEPAALHKHVLSQLLDTNNFQSLADHCAVQLDQTTQAWHEESNDPGFCTHEHMLMIALRSFWHFMFRRPHDWRLDSSTADLFESAGQLLANIGAHGPVQAVSELVRRGSSLFLEGGDLRSALGLQDSAQDMQGLAEIFRDNARLLLITGHGASATTTSWALWFLAHRRDLQDQIRDEMDSNLTTKPFSVSGLGRLDRAKQVINECLRLLPPGLVTSREVMSADHLCGRDLSAGSLIIIPFYALHRHRRYWTDPDEFVPERFAPESEQKPMKGAFLPFSAGAFTCLGARIAIVMSLAMLAGVLSRWEVLPPQNPTRPALDVRAVLHPKSPLRLRMRRLA